MLKFKMMCSVPVWASCCLLLCSLSMTQGFGLKDMFGAMRRRTENELEGPINGVVQKILSMIDSNEDGQIAFSEMRDYTNAFVADNYNPEEGLGYIMTLVTFMDTNHDEILESNEIRSALRIFVGLSGRAQLGKLVELSMYVEGRIRRQTHNAMGHQFPDEPQNPEEQIAEEVNVFMESLDADKNGLISDEEKTSLLTTTRIHGLGQDALRTMAQEDRNGDGALDKSEVTQWVERLHQDRSTDYIIRYSLRVLNQFLEMKDVVGTEIANLWMDTLS